MHLFTNCALFALPQRGVPSTEHLFLSTVVALCFSYIKHTHNTSSLIISWDLSSEGKILKMLATPFECRIIPEFYVSLPLTLTWSTADL